MLVHRPSEKGSHEGEAGVERHHEHRAEVDCVSHIGKYKDISAYVKGLKIISSL